MSDFDRPELKQRAPENKAADQAALQAIAQAAVDVELFTIPLYMVALYSIQGMHQITSKNNDFYQGRLWPGSAAAPDPAKAPNPDNARAFNLFYSVFIDEMLHLQLASNIAKALGVMPSFTSSMLQDSNYGWMCYGPDVTVIPHVLDFNDTTPQYQSIRVKLDALTLDHNRLFLAIEQNEKDAKTVIRDECLKNYFPTVPFDNWQPQNTERDLPMFGTIGAMYKCFWEYLEIEYTDKTKLFDIVFNRGTLARDLFNNGGSYHKPEYPKMRTMASGDISVPNAMENILDMINAITDQGEGEGVAEWIRLQRSNLLRYAPVKEQFQPDYAALNFNNPNYTDTGKPNDPSGQTTARSSSGGLDHHDRFAAIAKLLEGGKIVTWDQWHAAGNRWTADLLKTTGYDENKWSLPKAEEIATALNNLKADKDKYYDIFSHVAAGSIAGITRVLAGFWTNETTGFPSPSMYGSGDRVSICWAIFGQYPDLSKGIQEKEAGELYHACQGLDLDAPGNSCAPVEIFHSCRGSNTCKAESGCGFVQVVGQQGLCGFKVLKDHLLTAQPLSGPKSLYSAPSDNRCAHFGGCAIPISASQLYPIPDSNFPDQKGGTMELCDFVGETSEPKPFGSMKYNLGDRVHDVAWNAYVKVMAHRGKPAPVKPTTDSDIRVALPPST